MSGNTYRGTPTRNQGRGAVPFTNSPSGGSSIPRPVLEPSPPTETGSAVSASRQKQSKRDERAVKGNLDVEWKRTIEDTLDYIGGSENMATFLGMMYKKFPKKKDTSVASTIGRRLRGSE
ncbi:hypothetical protein FOC4_g10013010 [Fusarium odoratissimum]|uniref:Uncharacterized protein n=1 Tax=Fusarium oxysporum f. sp. cubense (strain race 4) TaxID=2502994 RepID=N1RWK9_FUSC4|nr:hypothetical protein FOC4_g10013010 [Fusarium odoratissimum]